MVPPVSVLDGNLLHPHVSTRKVIPDLSNAVMNVVVQGLGIRIS